MHLWEAKHPYYCNEGNYFANGPDQPYQAFKRWQDFIEEEGEADIDYNLVFRWDWREGEDHDLEPFDGDVNYRNGSLLVCFIGQRMGLYRWVTVEVCRADEPEVMKYLQPRLERLMEVWAPLTPEKPS